ncbi:MAG TPA: hypothetical protein VKR52_21080 [Terracidiphilus sp.]|nr:hypothetical protein [Terracidiphilus sp.]
MQIALHTPVAASKKEPLAEMAARVRKAFLDSGLGEPAVRFTFIDAPGEKGVLIDRVLKRHPEMERFVTQRRLIPADPSERRMISNSTTGEPADYATLDAILAGVPRSYPFPAISLHFHAPQFGERLIGLPAVGHSLPGVLIRDNSWVNGRERHFDVYTVAEAETTDKKLPPNPPAIDAVIKACGKARKTEHVPIRAPGGGLVASIPPEKQDAVKSVQADYRERIGEIVAAANMPHTLPPTAEALTQNVGVLAGPRKPALEAAFKPMGYTCTGGSGQFHIKRRTSGNLVAELYLDVGTWSHLVMAIFVVQGAGFRAPLGIPVAPDAFGQYPIGDAAQWQKIVENLAAMVRELDRTFVPAIKQAAGPSPAWYEPPS